MQFSVIYKELELAPLLAHQPLDKACTLYNILQYARRNTFRDVGDDLEQAAAQLIIACKAKGLQNSRHNNFQVVSKRSDGARGFLPLYVRSRLPKLKMLGQIKGKSLDELEKLMARFSQEQALDNGENRANSSCNNKGVDVKASNDREDDFNNTISSTIIVSSESIFTPFARRRQSIQNNIQKWHLSMTIYDMMIDFIPCCR